MDRLDVNTKCKIKRETAIKAFLIFTFLNSAIEQKLITLHFDVELS